MGRLFCSPVKLFKLFVNRNKIADKLLMQNSSWYFSSRGKAAYQKAKTVAEKTRYFYHYLQSIAPKISRSNESRNHFYQRIAFVMAHSMDDSSVYGGYPNILKPETNPLVRYVKESDNYIVVYIEMIMLFRKKEMPKKEFLNPLAFPKKSSDLPYPLAYMTLPEKDGSYSDLYKIERDIHDAWRITDYSYNIAKSIEQEATAKTKS